MMTLLSAFPAEGTAEFAELVRRQTAVGIGNVPTCERERLWRDEGIGKHYIPDRKSSTPRPRRSTAERPVAPAIKVIGTTPTPRPRHTKRFWEFWK